MRARARVFVCLVTQKSIISERLTRSEVSQDLPPRFMRSSFRVKMHNFEDNSPRQAT